MSTRRQTGLYRRITDLETLVERLEARLRDSIKQKHEPVAYLGRTATEIPQKSSGTLGEGEIFIYEVDKNKDEFDTAQRFKAVNFSSAGSIAEDKDVIALRVGRTQEFVIPRFPEANCLIAKVTTAISARSGTTPGSGVVDVVVTTTGSFVTDSPTSLDVYNAYDASIAVDQYIIIVEDAKEQKWWSVPKGGTTTTAPSLRVRGLTKALGSGSGSGAITFEMATGPSPFVVDNIQGIDAVWTGASEITVHNPRRHKVWNDVACEIAAEYNQTAARWELYDAQADRVVHGAKVSPSTSKFAMLNAQEGWAFWNSNPGGTIADAYWVKIATWTPTTRNLTFTYHDNTNLSLTFPNFLTDFTFNTLTCKFDVTRWTGSPVERAFPDFVTDVDLSSSGSTLVVDYCLEADSNLDMPYLISIDVGGGFLTKTKADLTVTNVIATTVCPP